MTDSASRQTGLQWNPETIHAVPWVLKLIHTATPDTTKLSCLCRVSFGGMNNFNVSVGLAAMRNKIQGKTNDEMRACN